MNLVLSVLLLVLCQVINVNPEIILEWNPIKVFHKEDPELEADSLAITRARVHRDDVYVAMSRHNDTGPITLGLAVWGSYFWLKNPIVKPFPDWSWQHYGDCSALQSVEALEVDVKGRLWVLDGGSLHSLHRCPPKLVIFQGEEVVKTVKFPPQEGMVCGNSSLRHLVVDRKGNSYYAYMSDSTCPGLLVYNLRTDGIWRLEHDSFKPHGNIEFGTPLAIHGVLLYYSPAGTGKLHTLQTWALRDLEKDLGISVDTVGNLLGPVQSMTIDRHGVLFYYVPQTQSMVRWDTRTPCVPDNQKILDVDDLTGTVTDLTTDGKHLVFGVTNYFDTEANNTASRCFTVYQHS